MHEVEASFELVALGERTHSSQSIGREPSALVDGFKISRFDDAMRAALRREGRNGGAIA